MTPQHYTQTIEPASRLPKEDQAPFWKGQIIKYFSRAGLKEGVPFEADFAKGLHCVERYKECLQEVVQEPTPAPEPTPKYRRLGPHTIPAGCRQLAEHEVVQAGDLVNDHTHPERKWTPAFKFTGERVADVWSSIIFARPIEPKPKYRDLGPHTIPDGCRQLADDEVVQDGDLLNDANIKGYEWEPVKWYIGRKVNEMSSHIVAIRPCTPPPTPPQS